VWKSIILPMCEILVAVIVILAVSGKQSRDVRHILDLRATQVAPIRLSAKRLQVEACAQKRRQPR